MNANKPTDVHLEATRTSLLPSLCSCMMGLQAQNNPEFGPFCSKNCLRKEMYINSFFSKPMESAVNLKISLPVVPKNSTVSTPENRKMFKPKILVLEKEGKSDIRQEVQNEVKETEESSCSFSSKDNSNPIVSPKVKSKASNKDKSRQDVVNKSLLRMVRRFYHRIFVSENKKLVKKRFVNVRFQDIFNAAKKLIRKYLGVESADDLAYFLIRMIGIKCKGDPGPQSQADEDAVNYSITMSSYSRERYSKVHLCAQFRTLFNYIFTQTLPNTEEPCLESLYEAEKKLINKEGDRYKAAFAEMRDRCLNAHN